MKNIAAYRAVPSVVTALWVLLALFLFRVLGQLSVALLEPSWLPAMEEWYSGLLPYRFLLPSQILIFLLLFRISRDVTRGHGFFAGSKPAFALPVAIFGYIYLGAMLLRYAIRMTNMPEERWTGGCIPIFMHWGLAIFLIVFAQYRKGRERSAR